MNGKHPDPLMVTLPYEDTQFHVHQLIRYMQDEGRSYIVTCGKRIGFDKHPKPNSLDYWVKANVAKSKSTVNSTRTLVDQLVATGFFEQRDKLSCPDSGRPCKGIMLKGDAC